MGGRDIISPIDSREHDPEFVENFALFIAGLNTGKPLGEALLSALDAAENNRKPMTWLELQGVLKNHDTTADDWVEGFETYQPFEGSMETPHPLALETRGIIIDSKLTPLKRGAKILERLSALLNHPKITQAKNALGIKQEIEAAISDPNNIDIKKILELEGDIDILEDFLNHDYEK